MNYFTGNSNCNDITQNLNEQDITFLTVSDGYICFKVFH